MRYREFAPHAVLRPYVRCYWELEGHAARVETILPDGCTEVVFHYGDPFLRDGQKQASAIFVGQMTAPVRLESRGPVGCFGVRFEPMGAWALSGVPQNRLTNAILEAEELFDVRTIGEAPDRKQAMERLLLARLPATSPVWQDGLAAVRDGKLTMRSFRSGTGIGSRQFERLFKERVGLTPRVFARLVRFRHALAAKGPWADIAAACGYSDQSHLIRDFREFAGSTPTNLPDDPLLMSQTFNTAAAGSV